MPAKSKQQFKFFKAMQEDPKRAKSLGISPQVTNDFTNGMTKDRWKKLKEKIGKK